jgi:hypothetical protein
MALRDLFQKDMGGLQGIQNTQMLYQSVKNSKISNEEIDE